MTKYYKVISTTLNDEKISRTSALIPTINGGVFYKKGVTVYPQKGCGPLCVFSSRTTAIKFSEHFGREPEVWECTIEISEKNYVWILKTRRLQKQTFLPSGTVLADSVTLTKKIKS